MVAARFRTVLTAVATTLLLVSPALASEPPSHNVTAPSTVGEIVRHEWTGLIPPGANSASECENGALDDHHTINLTVPPGLYDAVSVRATFFLDYDGPVVDTIATVVRPDGSKVSSDGGFVDTDESVVLTKPEGGTYEFLACMFAGAVPQEYSGAIELEAVELPATGPVGPTCAAPTKSPKFEEAFIDETRAGGEPIVTTYPDGTLLWGSHAGTTHFYGPAAPDETTAAFLENYEGQTYQYYSEDDGATWNFVPRLPNPGGLAGLPASGFSDPEFAIDQAGNVYISEINLANVAVSKSSDGGRSYTLQNFTAFTATDRQWSSADEEDVLYLTGNMSGGGTFPGVPVGTSGHALMKSTDGGVTFSQPELANEDGVADHLVDWSDGTLYELAQGDGNLYMGAFRGIRDASSDFGDLLELNTIAEGVGMSGIERQIGPHFDMDANGNLYVSWPENGTGDRAQGIWYSYSTDHARTWAPPLRVDPDANSDIWPWIAVGDQGNVAIVYLAVDRELEGTPGAEAEEATADDGWNVYVAMSETGLGCAGGGQPGFRVSKASSEPVHYATICQGGTVCQAEAVDRRLGDYFANEVDGNGNVYISVSNTTQGGSVSLPFIIRQVSGPNFNDDDDPPIVQPSPSPSATSTSTGPTATPTPTSTSTSTGTPTVAPTSTSTTPGGGGPLPTTGGAAAAVVAGGLLVSAAAALRRRKGV